MTQDIAAIAAKRGRTLTLYRDDSTVQVMYDRVKTFFWTANNTVLCISRYDAETGDGHHYIHWPRERFCWFRDQPTLLQSEHSNDQ